MTTFYSKDSPELKVGDDSAPPIRFHLGFAEVALDDPDRERKLAWIAHANSHGFPIENLGEDTDQVPEGEGNACPICAKSFKTPLALKGHLRSHQPKPEKG